MFFGSRYARRADRPHLLVSRGCGAALTLACLLSALPAAAQVAGERVVVTNQVPVENRASVSADVNPQPTEASAIVVAERSYGLALRPPRQDTIQPGGRAVFVHTLINLGSAEDAFIVQATAPRGAVAVYRDGDGNGALDASDPLVNGAIPLAAGDSAALLLVFDAEADSAARTVAIRLEASRPADPALSAALEDSVTVLAAVSPTPTPEASLAFAKAVDRAVATAGDTLTFTLTLGNGGDGPAGAVEVTDTLPAGVTYVAGSLSADGTAVSDAADGDAGEVAAAGGRAAVRLSVPPLAAGSAAVVSFRAAVAPTAVGDVSNTAFAVEAGGTPLPATATTRLAIPRLELEKTLDGAERVRAGDTVRFTIRVRNPSAELPVRDVVVSDTLPAGLLPLTADPPATIVGGVVTWMLGTLAPGAVVELHLQAIARPSAGDTAELVNRAYVEGAGTATEVAAAAALEIVASRDDELVIEMSAGVLEAELGDAVPYTLRLSNRSALPVAGVVIRGVVAAGMRLDPRSVRGPGAAEVSGDTLRIALDAPLAAGGAATFTYRLWIASAVAGARLENRAWARAAGGEMRSDTAVAWVRVRAGWGMQSRSVIGSVYVDADGDGRRGPDEQGIAGVEVWSEEGHIVTTDVEGKYSFRDLAPGRHVLHLDPLRLPRGMRPVGGALRTVRMSGWTSARADFRLLPAPPEKAAAAGPPPPLEEGTGAVAPPPGAVDHAGGATTAAVRLVAATAADELTSGPGIRILAPAADTVLPGNRVYVGVEAEAGVPVRLLDGDSLLAEAVTRPDGRWDFVAVELAPGPHRLRAWTRNSWGVERWDSIAVHRSGEPARLVADSAALILRRGAAAADTLRVQVLDGWGTPVASAPRVTVELDNASADGVDADAASVGFQTIADARGWIALPLRAGDRVGPGRLRLTAAGARTEVEVRVLPNTRPLFATGSAQVGIGAAPAAFGAVTARGAVGPEASVTVSVDTRRRDDPRSFFGGGYDPLDEPRYPIYGDASSGVALAGSEQLSIRLERGFDWAAYGDIRTEAFAGGEGLARYGRALSGGSGEASAMSVRWSGFASLTRQAVQQLQLRGEGTSGPYLLGDEIRPGTERLAVEIRARDDAARVLARQELARFIDYQIDYAGGLVLLKRAIPATDPQGNPVFLVANVERLGGSGERHAVAGMRMDADVRSWLGGAAPDSLRFGASTVHGGTGADEHTLLSADARLRQAGLAVGAQAVRSTLPDSSGVAVGLSAHYRADGAPAGAELSWLRVGDGFGNPADRRLVGGFEELRLKGDLRVSENARLELRHERQHFATQGAAREETTLGTEVQVLGSRVEARAGVTGNSVTGVDGGEVETRTAIGHLGWEHGRARAWLDGNRALGDDDERALRPDQMAIGASYEVLRGTRVEVQHRAVLDDSVGRSVQSVGLSSELGFGTRAWGRYEITGAADAATNAAVIGLNNRFSLPGGWSFASLLERRQGVGEAAIVDPTRALPFLQTEEDYSAASLGIDWAPQGGAYRMSAKGELRDGDTGRRARLAAAADVAVSRTLALLARQELAEEQRLDLSGGDVERASRRTILGMAMRPLDDDRINALFKLDYRVDETPLLGALVASPPRDERIIAASDVIYTPGPGTELSGRYALRMRATAAHDSVAGLDSDAHFFGARIERELAARWLVRLGGRLLAAGHGGGSQWSVAPALALPLGSGLEVEGGYRFGELRDPDFAVDGGRGWYALLGIHASEKTLQEVGDFWRERIRR